MLFLIVEAEFPQAFWTSHGAKRFASFQFGGGGSAAPESDIRLFDVRQNNEMNQAGWGASTKADLRYVLLSICSLRWRSEAAISRYPMYGSPAGPFLPEQITVSGTLRSNPYSGGAFRG
ncbi:MAG: hypothetical protein ACKVIN_15225 [Longimicrobiales bacterium]